MQKNELRLEEVNIDDLIPYENNPRVNDHAVEAVVASINLCGYITPIVVDEDMVVLAGHTRLKALKKAGEKTADVIICEGISKSTGRKYRLLDNKLNEKAQWKFNFLKDETEGIDFGYDFGIDAKLAVGDNIATVLEKQEKQNKEIIDASGAVKKICICPRCGKEFAE